MYEKLGEALRHHSGDRSFYRVVEDGDTKGFHSGKGIEQNGAIELDLGRHTALV